MPAVLEHIVDKLLHFRIVIDDENRTPLLGHAALLSDNRTSEASPLL
jgi:hypothetical protein